MSLEKFSKSVGINVDDASFAFAQSAYEAMREEEIFEHEEFKTILTSFFQTSDDFDAKYDSAKGLLTDENTRVLTNPPGVTAKAVAPRDDDVRVVRILKPAEKDDLLRLCGGDVDVFDYASDMHPTYDACVDFLRTTSKADLKRLLQAARARLKNAASDAPTAALLSRYDETVQVDSRTFAKRLQKENKKAGKSSAAQASTVPIKYRDGTAVRTRAKYVVEKDPKAEYDGGSRGRVKTKGKRGTGWA